MFPLRKYVNKTRNYLFWTVSRGGGWGVCELQSRTTLRKKQPCSQGNAPPPPTPAPRPPRALFPTVWFDWCRGCATSGSMRKGSSIQSQFIPFKRTSEPRCRLGSANAPGGADKAPVRLQASDTWIPALVVGSADGNLTITAINRFSVDGSDEFTSSGSPNRGLRSHPGSLKGTQEVPR